MFVRRIGMWALALFLLGAPSVFAEWAYPFVVWDGNVYVVSDTPIPAVQAEARIGRVTRHSHREGTYSGNFSNKFPKGTAYYRISGIPTDQAIAVETPEGAYVRANFHGVYAGGRGNPIVEWWRLYPLRGWGLVAAAAALIFTFLRMRHFLHK